MTRLDQRKSIVGTVGENGKTESNDTTSTVGRIRSDSAVTMSGGNYERTTEYYRTTERTVTTELRTRYDERLRLCGRKVSAVVTTRCSVRMKRVPTNKTPRNSVYVDDVISLHAKNRTTDDSAL